MEDELNVMPPLPSGEEMERQVLAEELAPYWLDPTQNYPEPHYLLQYNGVGFSPLGGIQALSGQKKNGKTFVLAQLIAAILGHGSERVEAYLHGLSVREDTLAWLGREPSVLYVDTEMEQLNSAKVLRRVHWLCQWEQTVPNERFRVLWLRQIEKTEKEAAYERRYSLIKKAIEWMQPTAVFIDGVRDIIGDFNNNEESSALVTDLMAIATKMNCCIWNVLHANPRMQNDDESKMRGHLGTELGNKVSDTFISQKKKDADTGRVTFTVKQQDARGKDVDDWKFEIVDDAGSGLGIPRIMSREQEVQPVQEIGRARVEELIAIIDKMAFRANGKTYTEINDALKEQGYTSNRKKKRIIDDALALGILSKAGNGRYYYDSINDKVDDNGLPF